uniref:LytR/AlgR family response regulator transcription factor n=1 Tax=uncultured Clostridium sp. TaxID=59620 RepID=UPI00261B5A5F
MINIAICDDEKIFLEEVFEVVSNLLKENEIKFEIDSFISGEDLLKEIESGNTRYDIVFLDIIMANDDGIEVGKKIKEIDEKIYILYISSSKEFLLDGYDVGAFNYILKPIDENRLKSQIFKLLEKIRKNEEILEINKAGMIIKLKIEWIYVNILDTKIRTILSCS